MLSGGLLKIANLSSSVSHPQVPQMSILLVTSPNHINPQMLTRQPNTVTELFGHGRDCEIPSETYGLTLGGTEGRAHVLVFAESTGWWEPSEGAFERPLSL